ncbi:MAG TPA: hypothetical protein VLE03_03280, partial [Nitrospiraceae bacterium]|nr:hypothetical protein [Nitrospiraceae bacterium]
SGYSGYYEDAEDTYSTGLPVEREIIAITDRARMIAAEVGEPEQSSGTSQRRNAERQRRRCFDVGRAPSCLRFVRSFFVEDHQLVSPY